MQLEQETVKLRDGTEIVVSEADFPASVKLQRMQKEAREKPLEDAILQSFRVGIYPTLAASSSGEPSLEEAYKLLEGDPEGIDQWYRAVRRLNTDWFDYKELNEKIEKIKFRDGLILTVRDWQLPSIWYRVAKLERDRVEVEDPREQAFAWAIYPKMAGCSDGDVPTEAEAYHWPNKELNKWYELVDKLNPQLFKALKDVKAEAETVKKKEPNE